jgi:3-phosphoinositide dependent protein kinase-1
MLAGKPPFRGASEYLTFQLITARELQFPANFPPAAADLVDRLLREAPAERIGASGLAELRAHPFFEGVDWARGARAAPAPALVPVRVQSDEEVALDWELSSLFRNGADSSGGGGGVYYEYLPTAAAPAAAGAPQRA